MRLSVLRLLAAALAVGAVCRAQSIEEILHTHSAAIGGKERIEATSAIRAVGTTSTPDGTLDFVMYAQRPDRVRVENRSKSRSLIQVYNGTGRPQEMDSKRPELGWHPMDPANAARFIADADFDDPLVAATTGRLTADYAGTKETAEGRRIQLLMTRSSEPPFWIFLDPDTYLVMGRLDIRDNPLGGKTNIVTHYDDFRLVGGILIPHHVLVQEGTVKLQETIITSIEPNPKLPADAFEPPSLSVPDSIASPAKLP